MSTSADPLSFLSAGEEAVIRHWSMYGQRGTTPKRRAMPWDWEQTQFIAPKSAPWNVRLEPHQLPLLLMGFIPTDPMNSGEVVSEVFREGERVQTHGFLSTSQNPDVRASEDKWFIHAVGPIETGFASLILCRSWTGRRNFMVSIQARKIGPSGVSDGRAWITGITWESDPNAWKDGMDEQQAKEIVTEVFRWVLQVELDGREAAEGSDTTADLLRTALDRLPRTGPGYVYAHR